MRPCCRRLGFWMDYWKLPTPPGIQWGSDWQPRHCPSEFGCPVAEGKVTMADVEVYIDLDEGTCSVGLLESAAEFFGPSLTQARATIREVTDVTWTWRVVAQEVGCRRAEVARMASAFEHDDLCAALRL